MKSQRVRRDRSPANSSQNGNDDEVPVNDQRARRDQLSANDQREHRDRLPVSPHRRDRSQANDEISHKNRLPANSQKESRDQSPVNSQRENDDEELNDQWGINSINFVLFIFSINLQVHSCEIEMDTGAKRRRAAITPKT